MLEKQLHHCTYWTEAHWGCDFSVLVNTCWLVCLFNYSYSYGCKVVSHWVLIYISLMADDVDSLLWCYWLFVYLWRTVYSFLLLIFCICLFLAIKFKLFPSVLLDVFFFCNSIIWGTNVLHFDDFEFVYFLMPVLFVTYQKNYCLIQDGEDGHLYFLLIVLYLTFSSLIHFNIIFEYDVW